MEKFNVLIEGNVPITIKAYDYHIEGDWVVFRDCFANRVAIVNQNRLIAIFPILEAEDDDD